MAILIAASLVFTSPGNADAEVKNRKDASKQWQVFIMRRVNFFQVDAKKLIIASDCAAVIDRTQLSYGPKWSDAGEDLSTNAKRPLA